MPSSSPVFDGSTQPGPSAPRRFLDPMQSTEQMGYDIEQFRIRLRPAPDPAIGGAMPPLTLDEQPAKRPRFDEVDDELSGLRLQK